MISERAGKYIVGQHLGDGHSFERIAAKWKVAHPDDAFTVEEAEVFCTAVMLERESGGDYAHSVESTVKEQVNDQAKPKLEVVSAPKKKAKRAPAKKKR